MASVGVLQGSFIRRFEREMQIAIDMRIAALMLQKVIQRAPLVQPELYGSVADASNIPMNLPVGAPGVKTEEDTQMPLKEYAQQLSETGRMYEIHFCQEIEALRKDPYLAKRIIDSEDKMKTVNERSSVLEFYRKLFESYGDGYLLPKETVALYEIDQIQMTHEIKQSSPRGY